MRKSRKEARFYKCHVPILTTKILKSLQRDKVGYLFYRKRIITMNHLSSRMSRPLFSNSWMSADVVKISWSCSSGLKDCQCCMR